MVWNLGHLAGRLDAQVQLGKDTTLAAGTKSGYKFTVAGTSAGYAAWATPVQANTTSVRAFCSVADAVVRTNTAPINTCAGSEAPLQ